ncbi:putative transcriptional regulator [Mycobacterium tuberculosis]|nr:putative transcriptional regulator [Mycobacterium tuberculosis]CKW91808.1 putative transcriptional regulator [Mycobacterium tuberculosis]
MRLRPAEDSDDFLAWSSTDTTIDDAVHVTGPYDYLLHIRVCDTADLDRLLRRLKTSAEAAQTPNAHCAQVPALTPRQQAPPNP